MSMWFVVAIVSMGLLSILCMNIWVEKICENIRYHADQMTILVDKTDKLVNEVSKLKELPK